MPGLEKQAHRLLRGLPAEDNRVTRCFKRCGVLLRDALESQAGLELYRESLLLLGLDLDGGAQVPG